MLVIKRERARARERERFNDRYSITGGSWASPHQAASDLLTIIKMMFHHCWSKKETQKRERERKRDRAPERERKRN
jgi:hypothetical protein